MKAMQRFILAKYVPDLNRMEPRNIGVFLWTGSKFAAKFLDAPSFVNDRSIYKRWVDFWKHEISGDSISPLRGKPVSFCDPGCIDVLLATQEGSYILVDAGEMVDSVKTRDTDKAIAFLFNDLVAIADENEQASSVASEHIALSRLCSAAIKESGVRSAAGFGKDTAVECPIHSVRKNVHFTYGIKPNGHAKSVYQRVSIDKDQSVHDAALKLSAVIDHALIPKERCIAMIQASQIAASKNGAVENRKLLEAICRVVDVDDQQNAVEQLRESIAG